MSVQPEMPISAPELQRALGPVHLVMLGIGAIIGAGIFVVTGQAAAEHAGPGIVISFAIAGFGCLFAALCYAEFAAMIPMAGSAYSYAHATLGQFFAWIIGWDLILEYLAAAAAVSVGWAGYAREVLALFGVTVPAHLASAPITEDFVLTGALFNLPAATLVAFLTALLIVGIRTSASFNGLMVLLKLAIVIVVIAFGLSHVEPANLTPFIPPNTGVRGEFGWSGVFTASGIVFFAFIGFDAVSVAAQEARNPQRDMPIGIIGSLIICTVLYILMAFTMTGLAPYPLLATANPVSAAVAHAGPELAWLVPLVNVGATIGIATVVLVMLLGQSRIFYAMSRDGMLPPFFSRVHPRLRTPWLGTLVTGTCAGLLAGLVPGPILFELVSIGTLTAFVIVCISIIVLRSSAPNAHRPFRTPLVPLTPLLGVGVCGFMIVNLPLATQLRFIVWLFLGLIVYSTYAARRARAPEWSFKG
jgi:APA family basic amino acid/polyamine antiporter